MHCDQAETLMFDYVEDRLSHDMRMRVGDHLEGCASCQGLHNGILDMQAQARVWHDVAPPPWQLPRVHSRFDLSGMAQWFPSLASAVALILVITIYFQQPGQAPLGQPALLPSPTPSPMANTDTQPVLEHLRASSRDQRQQEMEALVRLLKAEMDRRSLETEESLRYVIAHQIQGQRELDDLSRQVQQINYPVPAADTRGERM
ncbi:MAG: zf-HC2 domain-containing protein [Gammaproteobacteria bacterium]|nr:zf-HC2 domain-containing protein [Gammaproteobacteria bacterium]